MELDIDALFGSLGSVLKMFLFFGALPGRPRAPALLIYRDLFNRRDRFALAFFTSTQLPLVLAITTVAAGPATCTPRPPHRWSAPRCSRRSIFPMLGLRLREGGTGRRSREQGRGRGLSITLIPDDARSGSSQGDHRPTMTHSFTPTPQPRREPVQESHWVLWSVLPAVAFWPRLWILAFWIFGRQIGDAFDGWIVPALGFLFLPWATLMYAWMWAVSSDWRARRGMGARRRRVPDPRLVLGRRPGARCETESVTILLHFARELGAAAASRGDLLVCPVRSVASAQARKHAAPADVIQLAAAQVEHRAGARARRSPRPPLSEEDAAEQVDGRLPPAGAAADGGRQACRGEAAVADHARDEEADRAAARRAARRARS